MNTREQLPRVWSSPAIPHEELPGLSEPPTPDDSHTYRSSESSHAATHGFAQIFGLHPAVAFLTFIVDSMLFGGEGIAALLGIPTVGASIVFVLTVSITAACIVGLIAYLAQQRWYGDDKQSAFIKALILAFLTAIPTNIPAFVYVSAGIVGLFRPRGD